MTDPFARELADRVTAATPTTLAPFDEIPRRARRDRARSTLVVAAGVAVVAGVSVGSWALRGSDPDTAPDLPITSESPSPSEDPTSARPEPDYERSEYPSGLVVRTAERDIDLPADTSCWTAPDKCRRGLLMPGDPGPDLGESDAVDFWFARPGWEFNAVFRRVGEDCPRATSVDAIRTDDQWFRLAPADRAGSFVVDLFGEGPEGRVAARFLWTTTSDGPVDPPSGALALFPDSLGPGSFAVEVLMNDLPFQPSRSDVSTSVGVTVTSSDDRVRTLSAPLVPSSLDCGPRGDRGLFFYQLEPEEDFAVLGREPLDVVVELTIRGTTHVGRATWRDPGGGTAYVPLSFTPPLPSVDGG